MDVALKGVASRRTHAPGQHVSILVLLDVALKVWMLHGLDLMKPVSILVLLDVALKGL